MNKKETAEEFVRRMLTGLTAKTLPDYPNSTFYVNDKDELIVEIIQDIAYVRCYDFWRFLRDEYKLGYDDCQLLIKRKLKEHIKTKGVEASSQGYKPLVSLEKKLKTNGAIVKKPIRGTRLNRQVVSDLKKEVKKTETRLKKLIKAKCEIDIDSKRIKKFLAQTTGANYQFLSAMMDVRNGINNIITNYKLSKEEVCERFGVSKRKYNDFILGNYEYDLKVMAVVNALFCEYETKNLKENAPFQTPKTEGK